MRAIDALDSLWPRILAGTPPPAGLDAARWEGLADRAQAHGLGAALSIALKRAGTWPDLPSTTRERLDAQQRAATLRALQWRATLQRVLDALAPAGIVPVAYKGAALAFLTYPDAAMRPMVDLDLWLDAEQMRTAAARLQTLGFAPESKTTRPDAWQEQHEGEIKLRHPVHGLVELHWGVFAGEWLKHATRIDRAAVRGRVREVRLFQRPLRVLAARDHLIQVALHATISNRLSLSAMRCLLDVALLAREIDDWPTVLRDLRDWRVARSVGHVFALSAELFGDAALQQAARELAAQHSPRWLYRHIDAQDVLQRRGLRQSWKRWTYLLCAADRRRDALRLLLHTLWPSRSWLLQRYGAGGLRWRLRHVASALRGEI